MSADSVKSKEKSIQSVWPSDCLCSSRRWTVIDQVWSGPWGTSSHSRGHKARREVDKRMRGGGEKVRELGGVCVCARSLRSCRVLWNTHGLNSKKRPLQNPQIWQTEPLTHSLRANYVRERWRSRSNPDSVKQEISVHSFFGPPEACHILKWYPLEWPAPANWVKRTITTMAQLA